MRTFGFSTGALGRRDLPHALEIAEQHRTDAVEYSALRMAEFDGLVGHLLKHGPGGFDFVSIHAPSKIAPDEEAGVVSSLRGLVERFGMLIVVHPDAIHEARLWLGFGGKLCIENMDDRKAIGRTADELEVIFAKLPEARLCFDIGHAHEIDRSMSLGYEIVKKFRDRITHIHASEVSDEGVHRAFSASSHTAFAKVADLLPKSAAVILETDVPEGNAGAQLAEAKQIFRTTT